MAGTIIFLILLIIAIFALAINRAALWGWMLLVAGATLYVKVGLPGGTFQVPSSGFWPMMGWIPTIILALLCIGPIRQKFIIRPAFDFMKNILPPVSSTEQEALEAGTVGWDAELFSGDPNWTKLRSIAPINLTDREKDFLDGPTERLCERLNDWEIRHTLHDIPKDIWQFVRDEGFLGMLISEKHGGLGFSPQAQSLILGKISSRSADAVTIVMVPNSLGPGELIEKYGTSEQKEYYLPRLAQGQEVPCFGLTGPTSGSDAAAMRDIGIVCHQQFEGKDTLGIRLNWDKRYISLGPDATLLGLAFRLSDPDGLLGRGEDLGITLALVPTEFEGVEIGRRHLPCGAAFPNGPNWGRDVFLPMDYVIGGQERVGQGWRMLMSCLSAGRSISLPASSAAGIKSMLRNTTAYAQIRKQFGISISRMEGIEEPLSRMVEQAYVVEAGRAVTASMVAGGEKPAVISALLKYQSTERMRQCVNDAMDIHGGRAICDGPTNYIQGAYQMVPVGITVEGANILTRTLISFTQGALRSHPWLFREIQAIQDTDRNRGMRAFEEAFVGHISYSLANIFGAFYHNLTGGLFAKTPIDASYTAQWYGQLARASKNFALVADITVATLGGGLKVRQKLTGRLADALSELYLLSCVLKRFEDDGEQLADVPIMEFAAQNCLYRFQEAMLGVVNNFPISGVGWVLRPLVFPLGARWRPASDKQGRDIVRLALEPGDVRDRLTRDIYISTDENDATGLLEVTLSKVLENKEADRKIERAVRKGLIQRYHGNDWFQEAVDKGIVTAHEAQGLREVESLVDRVIAVDHFDRAELQPHYQADKATANAAAAE
ncbi:MAG: acyl-CoA dehydrogenase [Methyloligellaceae bacterium]